MSDDKHTVLAFIARGDGAILSVWNRKHHCWGLPGGKVEEGESLDVAIRRELLEEVGMRPEKIWFPEIDISPTYSGSDRICHTLAVKPTSLIPMVREVGTGVGWMTREFLCDQNDEHLGWRCSDWFKEFFAGLDRRA